MTSDLQEFVQTSFRTVWSLELLLLLFRNPARRWSEPELVGELRSSDVVVAQSIASLVSAGLVVVEADGTIAYAPASAEIDAMVADVDDLYRRKPGTVRRAIIQNTTEKLQTFANAFKLRKS